MECFVKGRSAFRGSCCSFETSAYRNTLREHGVQTVRAQNSVNLVSVILGGFSRTPRVFFVLFTFAPEATAVIILSFELAALTIGMGSFGVLFLTCQMVLDGRMSVGSVVMVNSYLMQLYLPLNSLGRAYRMIKNAMVDMVGGLFCLNLFLASVSCDFWGSKRGFFSACFASYCAWLALFSSAQSVVIPLRVEYLVFFVC